MFGLMKNNADAKCQVRQQNYRLNYCGTCKAIGSTYSHKSRLFLNRDIVFLSQILSELATDNDINKWDNNLHSINCFHLPDSTALPSSLKFTAAANVLLAEFKIKDDILDHNGLKSHLFAGIENFFSEDFYKSKEDLIKMGFPVGEVLELIHTQNAREQYFSRDIKFYAESTAKITGKFFSFGVEYIGQEKLKKTAYQLGFNFGMLVYLLDAVKDLNKDLNNKGFNPIASTYKLSRIDAIRPNEINKIKQYLASLIYNLKTSIQELPLSVSSQEDFIKRLKINTQGALDSLSSYSTFNDTYSSSEGKVVSVLRGISMFGKRVAAAVILVILFLLPKSMFAQMRREGELVYNRADMGPGECCIYFIICIFAAQLCENTKFNVNISDKTIAKFCGGGGNGYDD